MRKIMHQTRVLLFVCFAMVFAVPASAQIIKTVAGGGSSSGDGGPAVSAQLNAPIGVAVDNAGNLFIAEMLNARIRRVDGQPPRRSYMLRTALLSILPETSL